MNVHKHNAMKIDDRTETSVSDLPNFLKEPHDLRKLPLIPQLTYEKYYFFLSKLHHRTKTEEIIEHTMPFKKIRHAAPDRFSLSCIEAFCCPITLTTKPKNSGPCGMSLPTAAQSPLPFADYVCYPQNRNTPTNLSMKCR